MSISLPEVIDTDPSSVSSPMPVTNSNSHVKAQVQERLVKSFSVPGRGDQEGELLERLEQGLSPNHHATTVVIKWLSKGRDVKQDSPVPFSPYLIVPGLPGFCGQR